LNESRTSSSPPTGRDRRAFERHPVNLAAEVFGSDSAALNGHIRDFCIGGMLLTDPEQLATPGSGVSKIQLGTPITIRFSIPGKQTTVFNARVVRKEEGQAGVALINPDLSVLQHMLEYANSQKQLHKEQAVNDMPAEHEDFSNVRDEVIALTTHMLPGFASSTLDKITNEMFEAAKSTADITEQNGYFSALSTLSNFKEKFVSQYSEITRQ